MQTRNDGTHVILPAAAPIERRPDRVGLPVMLPRESDGKMHRDGKSAAVPRPETAIAECGGLHGAPELETRWEQRIVAKTSVFYSIDKEKRRCSTVHPKHNRLGRQDKRPHIAAWTVGCFDWVFWPSAHIVRTRRDVYASEFSLPFNEIGTSRRISR
ncbi:hypothetical protein QN219_30385 [Sinorhizobium sp. 7-81]|uniref:hypothetical protein n=1 Tax=Sinorhizobium sp. 8-89 TaxID=3049089 RepID=UPI0024C2581C|nr:hypothetical protein [Sinorhizobium sp. 8-89]MDK1494271.1 hypothetical protein [Sinorhizobium sp. 8-89]